MTTKEQIELLVKKINFSKLINSRKIEISLKEANYILESLKELQAFQNATSEILLRQDVNEIKNNLK